MRSPAAHSTGDVSGTCRLPNRCFCTGEANTRRAVEWAECRQTSSFSDLANDHPRHLQGVDAYRDALDSARIKLGLSADEILGRPAFPYAKMKTDVKLAVLSAAELGVESDESSLSDVYERARRVGLELCPAEVGPQLRLQYRNQPLGEALDIAMAAVATYSGDTTILTPANWGTGLILIGRDGRSESTVNRISRFVFALPTRERLEAKSSPQMAPTFSEQSGPAVR